jgi:hypothetical protein
VGRYLDLADAIGRRGNGGNEINERNEISPTRSLAEACRAPARQGPRLHDLRRWAINQARRQGGFGLCPGDRRAPEPRIDWGYLVPGRSW